MYTNYVQNYDAANLKITEMMKSSKFEAFLKQCKENPLNKRNLTLESYLIQPVQRTMRYELLLRELLKHTWPDHPDYAGLSQAIEKVHHMAEQLNLRKREGENNRELVKIDYNLTGKPKDLEIIIPSRKFISKYVLKSKSGPVTVVVCSDVLIIAKGDEKLKFVDCAPVNECEALPVEDKKKKGGDNDGCELEIRKWGTKKPIAAGMAESAAVRNKIVEEVREAGEKRKESTRLHKQQIRRLSGENVQVCTPDSEEVEKHTTLTPEEQLLERKREK